MAFQMELFNISFLSPILFAKPSNGWSLIQYSLFDHLSTTLYTISCIFFARLIYG